MRLKIKTDVIKAVISMMTVASKDETRKHLNIVQIHPSVDYNDCIEVMACDGHVMAMERFKDPILLETLRSLSDLAENQVISIERAKFARLKALLKETPKYQKTIETDLGDLFGVELKLPNACRTGELMPNINKDTCAHIAIDFEVLDRLKAFLKQQDMTRGAKFKLWINNETAPLVIEGFNNAAAEAVVMPVRWK